MQSLETLGEVIGVEECLDVLAKLVVAVVVVAPNGRLFESTVHPLDLPVRPPCLETDRNRSRPRDARKQRSGPQRSRFH